MEKPEVGSINSNPLFVLICTRNRSDALSKLLQCEAFSSNLLEKVIVVDSSSEEHQIWENRKTCLANPNIELLNSLPGLPHQRNVGCAHIEMLQRSDTNPIVCFLDDDVLIDDSYFEKVIRLIDSKELVLGAWDANLTLPNPGVLRMFLNKLGILTTNSFGISAAGLTNVGPIDFGNQIVDWVPGHSFSMPLSVWQEHKFSDSVRMTGEDLEFQFRASNFPKVMSKTLSVRHARSPIGRFSAGSVAFSEALFRAYLARAYSHRFSRGKVLLGTLVTAIYQLSNSPSSSMASLRCAFLDVFSKTKLDSLIRSAGYQLEMLERSKDV